MEKRKQSKQYEHFVVKDGGEKVMISQSQADIISMVIDLKSKKTKRKFIAMLVAELDKSNNLVLKLKSQITGLKNELEFSEEQLNEVIDSYSVIKAEILRKKGGEHVSN